MPTTPSVQAPASTSPTSDQDPSPEEIIAAAVWAYCIRTGEPATAKTLATETKRSVAWVRKHWAGVGCRADIVCCDAFVPRFDKNFGHRLADQRVDALRPTWKALAAKLRGSSADPLDM